MSSEKSSNDEKTKKASSKKKRRRGGRKPDPKKRFKLTEEMIKEIEDILEKYKDKVQTPRGKSKMLKRGRRQTKVKKHNIRRDAARVALPPGKRISAKGNKYYEYRVNRSDLRHRV